MTLLLPLPLDFSVLFFWEGTFRVRSLCLGSSLGIGLGFRVRLVTLFVEGTFRVRLLLMFRVEFRDRFGV